MFYFLESEIESVLLLEGEKIFAEFIGTFALVLIGTGAIVFHDLVYPIGNHGIAIAFGGIVALMIFIFGHISGAHINPAVSMAFIITNDINKKEALPYCTAQIIGGLLALLLLLIIFPTHETLGTTQPKYSWTSAFVLEFFLTYVLMLIILIFGKGKNHKNTTAIAVGLTVGLEAYFAGPYTGASMNPARSIAPALISGHLEHLWIYIVATILGAVLASFTWKFFKK